MELINYIAPINLYLKIFFILSLFILNIYLLLTYKFENNNIHKNELLAGFGNRNLKTFLTTLGTVGGYLSAYITVKNEIKDYQIGKINQLQEIEREEVRRSIEKDRDEHHRLLNSIDNNREELYKLYNEKAKLIGHNDRLLDLYTKIKENVSFFKDKSTDLNIKLSELSVIDHLIKKDINEFSEEVNCLISKIDYNDSPVAQESSTSRTDEDMIYKLDKGINKSNILNIDLFSMREWFENLIGIKKIAVCLILGKSVILSALISIIFIFYGNILIEKFDLINKYPKIAKFIELRKKYQKYYFRLYCFLIFIIAITEIIFGISILFL